MSEDTGCIYGIAKWNECLYEKSKTCRYMKHPRAVKKKADPEALSTHIRFAICGRTICINFTKH